MAQNMQDRIREEAYRLWETEGKQEGREMDYWLAAEQKILGSSKKSRGSKPAVAVVKSTRKTSSKKK